MRADSVAIRPTSVEVAAWVVMGVLLVAALKFHLLPALLGGLLVYELVQLLAPPLGRFTGSRAKVAGVALISAVVVVVLSLGALGLAALFRSDTGGLTMLIARMADIVESSKTLLPAWVVEYLPQDGEGVKVALVDWLRAHAAEVQTVGKEAGRGAIHVLIGMIVGAMVALHKAAPEHQRRPFSRAMTERAARLSGAFRRIVFAQVRIAALNTFFTWLYLGVALPLAGIHLPFMKTLILVTFFAGLLPVIGNLISNTVIVVVSLSVSLQVAVGSLAFLVVIHKLEYFLNARIVGTQIRSKAWELLLAMLVMEGVFGILGVVAAPIYYAYLKDELQARGLV